ncbi:hypothetical protein AB0G00_24100 [Nocardia salmonicida]|uniref:hypothetical protein n=1 Tax=Nocardia salmonicida TaxID=53431 RepID=UPI0033C52572
MKPVQIKWNNAGFRALRSAPGVVADLEARAARIRAAAAAQGGEYKTDSQMGASNPQGRWRVSIYTADYKAKRRNAKHHSLLRAIDAGR